MFPGLFDLNVDLLDSTEWDSDGKLIKDTMKMLAMGGVTLCAANPHCNKTNFSK